MSIAEFSFVSIDGKKLPLAGFAGHPILLVNVASQCGFTSQYVGLQQLHATYGPKGLVVLGVPCNDFGEQEPGSEAEIKGFCESTYRVEFPMTQKESVIGAKAHAVYQWIAEQLGEDQAPRWNFHKYLIGRDGEVIETWPSRVSPLSPEIRAAIEASLAS